MKSRIALLVSLAGGLLGASQLFAADSWTETLVCPDEAFTNVSRNAYFVLEPGWQTVLAGKEGGKLTEVTSTVLGETQDIGLVEDGKLKLVKHGYVAR